MGTAKHSFCQNSISGPKNRTDHYSQTIGLKPHQTADLQLITAPLHPTNHTAVVGKAYHNFGLSLSKKRGTF